MAPPENALPDIVLSAAANTKSVLIAAPKATVAKRPMESTAFMMINEKQKKAACEESDDIDSQRIVLPECSV